MHTRRKIIAVMAAVATLWPGLAAPAQAAEDSKPRRIVSAWLPNWLGQAPVQTVLDNADLFTDVSPTWFSLDLVGGRPVLTSGSTLATRTSVTAQLRGAGVEVYPMVSDEKTSRYELAGIIGDPGTRSALVTALVSRAVTEGYTGLDLDFERFAFTDSRASWVTTRPNWVAFVAQLSAALHQANKKLMVTTPPLYSESRTLAGGYWVYDWKSIAPYVDRLRVMTYDYSVSRPGPISPLNWTVRTMRFASTVVPGNKLQMGVPAYGRDWVGRKPDGSPDVTGICPASNAPSNSVSFTAANARSWFAGRGVVVGPDDYHPDSAERTTSYVRTYTGTTGDQTLTCTVRREAWWVDAAAAMARAANIDDLEIGGIALWQGGGIDPALWAPLRAYATQVRQRETATRLTGPASIAAGKPATLRGRGDSEVGVREGSTVTIQSAAEGSPLWKTVGTTTVGASGDFTFATTPITTATRFRAVVAGSWWRLPGVSPVTRVAVAAPKPVRPPMKLVSSAPSTVALNRAFTITARTTPATKGAVVSRQILRTSGWRTAGTTQTNASGVARFTIPPISHPMTLTYRLAIAGPSGTAYSPTFIVRVK